MDVVVRCRQRVRQARLVLLLLGSALAAPVAQAAAPGDVAAVLDCMRGNVPKTLTVRDIQLSATDRNGGTRSLQGRIYATREGDRLRAMVRIAAPADLAGAAYLLREREGNDEMYLYMPALNKVRRINGAATDGSLWGTDLSYDDVRQLSNAFSGAEPVLEANETVDGRAMHVMSVTPKQTGARFDRLRAWVDAKTCMTVRMDFLQGGVAQKRLSIDPKDLQRSGNYWHATQLVVSDLKQGSRTQVKLTGVTPDKELAERLFAPATFHLGN